jgi:hypothetical protein
MISKRRRFAATLVGARQMARKKKFDVRKEVRKLARERVGKVPPAKPIEPKSARKKPKYKKAILDGDSDTMGGR